ncbi:MAG: type II CRISPR RNA-guided endonuclease Cas9 [Filifactoraceae bacterium]
MYEIGLDIGITSVGWSALELNNDGDPKRIVDFGVRIFDAAEIPKTGGSLAQPRRDARGARRRNRRHKHRMERIKKLLQRKNIIKLNELESIYNVSELSDIYEIRNRAISAAINNEEFARLLIHLAQRRGFKSNRKLEISDKEAGKLLTAVSDNKKLLNEKGYRTIGEMLYKDDKFAEHKRNKAEDYSMTFDRSMLVEEIKYIFDCQRKFGNDMASNDLEEEYIDIYTSQRAFDEGPGGESKYGGNQIEKMIGKCTFIKEESRAPKATHTFEYFNLLTNINNMMIVSGDGKRGLEPSEMKKVIELAYKSADLTYKKIRKILELKEDEYFGALTYGNKEVDDVEKAKFEYLQAYHKMRIALDKISKSYINNLNTGKKDHIGYAFTVFKTDEKISAYLTEKDFSKIEIDTLIDTMPAFKKVGNLSIIAMKKIIPFLEEGLKYNEACGKAGFDFRGEVNNQKSKLLPPLPIDLYEISSPVVKRAISQAIKVVNGIIKKYGEPAKINIELAREMSKNFTDRKKIEKTQEENRKNNEKAKQNLQEDFGLEIPRALDVLKHKLWQEQDGKCPYTLKSIEIERLFENGYCEIDHIIPYSISFDDSYKNKILVLTSANREKGNRLPLQYIKNKDEFTVWVKNQIKDKDKRAKLLKEKFSEEEQNEMKKRNLQDTQHITSFFAKYLKNNLMFDENLSKKERVTTVNGRVTAYMRRRWGINKIRENGDLHHAVDAIVVACITPGIIQKVTKYIKYKEEEYITNQETGEVNFKRHFPLPWDEFSRELDIRLGLHPVESLIKTPLANYADLEDLSGIKSPFVSRMPVGKGRGEAHEETVRGKYEEDGILYSITKESIKELKIEKDGEIKDYYNKESDIKLYEALKVQLKAHGGDGKKAFEQPFYKPAPKGGKAPLVKSVKLIKKMGLGVDINGGITANGNMVRIDVFYVEKEGYYFVPIYISDLVKPLLPNKAVVPNKAYKDWKEMKDENFIFSLKKNDLIRVIHKSGINLKVVSLEANLPETKEVKEQFLYYIKAGISTASISVITHDNSYRVNSLGIKSLTLIEKYSVDTLGNYQKIGIEKRIQNSTKR